jgi:hydroxyacylglutathione hydrolase
MNILSFECGPISTRCYLLTDEASKECILIDCPPEAFSTLHRHEQFAELDLKEIIITHGHWDHTGDAAKFARDLGTPVAIHKLDEPFMQQPGIVSGNLPPGIEACSADKYIDEDSVIRVGGSQLSVLHVPGHTPGHIALYHQDSNSLFAGDLLFYGSIGRTDFKGGDYDTLMESIRTKVLPLAADTTVYPGHGPNTTVQQERESNPFIQDYLSHFDNY